MRLVKYLAHCGVASRRRAELFIKEGRVKVDGHAVTDPAHDVDGSRTVEVDGREVATETHEYYLLNKPKGVVSTAEDPQGRAKVTDLVSAKSRVYPVGRLDVDTTGLIILTNDGELANLLMHPSHGVEKSYKAVVRGRVSQAALLKLSQGVKLDDGITAPAKVRVLKRGTLKTTLQITVHEGRKRQLRRMCEAVGHPVVELERSRIGPIKLAGLGIGRSRPMTAAEIDELRHNLQQ